MIRRFAVLLLLLARFLLAASQLDDQLPYDNDWSDQFDKEWNDQFDKDWNDALATSSNMSSAIIAVAIVVPLVFLCCVCGCLCFFGVISFKICRNITNGRGDSSGPSHPATVYGQESPAPITTAEEKPFTIPVPSSKATTPIPSVESVLVSGPTVYDTEIKVGNTTDAPVIVAQSAPILSAPPVPSVPIYVYDNPNAEQTA